MDIECILLKQDGKNYVHINDTEVYFKNLNQTFEYIKNDANAEFLNFAFIALCASTLEASLNHIIFTFYINNFGPIEYKRYAESLINMSFSNKLHSIPNIVSKTEFYFNSECFTIKKLDELIALRNKILHKKPTLQEVEYDLNNIELGMKLTFKNNNHIQSITKNQCLNFNKAMMNFKNEFMIPFLKNDLKENKLMKRK
jgi:hypothetical protein